MVYKLPDPTWNDLSFDIVYNGNTKFLESIHDLPTADTLSYVWKYRRYILH